MLAALLVLASEPELPLVGIQPLGRLGQGDAAVAAAALTSFYRVRTASLPAKTLPSSAYYTPRKRYRAEKLLQHLDAVRPVGCAMVVGVTSADISTTVREVSDWGVFGLGNLGGTACVVSTHRLGRSRVSPTEFRTRLTNLVRHEAGHVLGLPHCPAAGCLMGDAMGSIKGLTGKLTPVCPKCGAQLGQSLR